MVVLVSTAVVLVLAELGLRNLGFGNPVLYDSNPFYGYRPRPNQDTSRPRGPALTFNNLGLRCDRDWDADGHGKILFLGDSVTYGGTAVANDELFSALATRGLDGYTSCNGGVNAWGIENIHGLLVESEFLPARHYVTVVIEDDFYRGLVRVHGQLLWCRRPTFAFEEALLDFCHYWDDTRYLSWRWYAGPAMLEKVVDKAARELAEIDRLLASKGFVQRIYISPLRSQVVGTIPKDAVILSALRRQGVEAVYLGDRLAAVEPDRQHRNELFLDNVHLTPAGHALWGKMINQDLRALLPRR